VKIYFGPSVWRNCCIPGVEDASGEGNHEKVVESGPGDVHQDAPEGHMAAKGRKKLAHIEHENYKHMAAQNK
jgi:hypothetical protein